MFSNSISAASTQEFNTQYSESLGCWLTDSPGLGNYDMPLNQWLAKYNEFNKGGESNSNSIDLVLVVIERVERVSAHVV